MSYSRLTERFSMILKTVKRIYCLKKRDNDVDGMVINDMDCSLSSKANEDTKIRKLT